MRLSSSSVLRATVVTALPVWLLVGQACIPHPSADYDEFLETTESMRSNETPDGGGQQIEASVPIESQEGTYLAACLPSLSGSRADKALRFFAETKFTPDEDGETGKLSLILHPFAVDNTVFDKANTVGEPLVVGDALQIGADAGFSGTVARAEIARQANTISPRDIVIENTAVSGKFAASGNFCSSFDTTVTAPITQTIVARCNYIPLEVGDTYEVKTPAAGSPTSAIIAGGVEYTHDMFGCAD